MEEPKTYEWACPECKRTLISRDRVYKCPKCGYEPPIEYNKETFDELMYEPWNGIWENYENGKDTNIDFRLWFHDLYRPSHRPYDPKETELIRRICDLADEDKRLDDYR